MAKKGARLIITLEGITLYDNEKQTKSSRAFGNEEV
jgi:hypothetical protein